VTLPLASRLAWALCLVATTACGEPGKLPRTGTLRAAVTPALSDSGLLPVLLDAFRVESGIEVTPAVASVADCLATGARGDADVVVVDDAEAASAFVAAGKGVLSAEVFRRGESPPRISHVAVLVRPVAAEHQRNEPARRLYDWLAGPRCADLVRDFRPSGRRLFFLPGE
jgi:ABC-type tungstate transport system permease subunit